MDSQHILSQDHNRQHINWFNPIDPVPIKSIWPDRDLDANSVTTVPVLILRWRNDFASRDSAWAGIMRSTGEFSNLSNAIFMELWVRGEEGQLNIDLGTISEDVWIRGQFPDPQANGELKPSYRRLNTEDRNFDGTLDEGEDSGIDGVAGQDGTNVPNDAGDDDWAESLVTQPEFARINGTEGNARAQGAKFPDTEDLDSDGILNLSNHYLAYSIDLADTTFLAERTFFSDGTPTGWKLYRLPLESYRFSYGDPNLTFHNIRFIRVWMNDIPPMVASYDSVSIVEFNFVDENNKRY
jgi:cell surface protein SprA